MVFTNGKNVKTLCLEEPIFYFELAYLLGSQRGNTYIAAKQILLSKAKSKAIKINYELLVYVITYTMAIDGNTLTYLKEL